MEIKDFVVFIILFIFADIIFYLVVMKGLMVKSITEESPVDRQRRELQDGEPGYSGELYHTAPLKAVIPLFAAAEGNLAEQAQDLTLVMREQVERLGMRNLRAVAPRGLIAGEAKRLELGISHDIIAPIMRALNHAAPSNVTTLKIGAQLAPALTGDGFRVTPLTPVEQALAGRSRLQWAWEVLPLKGGKRALALDVTLKMKTPAGEETRVYSWPELEVKVEPNHFFAVKQLVKNRWKVLLAGISVLAAGLYAWLRW
ncbi:MAG: hypothetical protein C4528_07420 [Gammaproteobacteria bacterium]|nr:MAG: hypothetical protein C4528_07420 [Gammaproteobacteria bacterium]